MIDLLRHRFFCLVFVSLFWASAYADLETPVADTLSLWVMDNGVGSQKAVQRIVKKFHKETGIHVKVQTLNWSSAFTVISKAFENPDSAEGLPDVIQLGSTWVAHFAAAGLIRPIDSLMVSVDSSRFFVEAYKNTHVDGQPGTFSIPWFVDIRGLFANERLWFGLGLKDDDISTYPKFLGTLKTVAKSGVKNARNESVAPFALPGKDDWTGPQEMAPLIWNHGGRFLVKTANGYRSGLVDSTTLRGISLYVQIMGDTLLAPYSLMENSAQNAERYIKSRQLLLYGTSELIRQLEFDENVGGLKSSELSEDGILVVNPPKGPAGQFSFLGGSHLALPVKRDTTKLEASQNLLVYLVRADNIDAYSRQVGFLPSDKSIIRIWNQDKRYSQLVKNLENGRGFLNIPEWCSVENILSEFSNNVGKILSNNKNRNVRAEKIAESLLDVHKRINAKLSYVDSLNDAEILVAIKLAILQEIALDVPETEKSAVVEDSLPVAKWRFANFIFILVPSAIVVAVLLLGLKFYWKKKKENKS